MSGAEPFDRAGAVGEWFELAPREVAALAEPPSAARRAALERDVAAYLARGGSIQVCPDGASGRTDAEIIEGSWKANENLTRFGRSRGIPVAELLDMLEQEA